MLLIFYFIHESLACCSRGVAESWGCNLMTEQQLLCATCLIRENNSTAVEQFEEYKLASCSLVLKKELGISVALSFLFFFS